MEEQYDIAGRGIVCNADKFGAKVFEVRSAHFIRPIKVLAYNPHHAAQSLADINEEDFPPEIVKLVV
jgi:hypothetical protein